MVALFVYLFIALFISFLCSIMESVLLSTPQSFLIVKQNEGKAWAKSFIDLKINIDKPLSAILTLNTVAHTVGAAGVGAEAVKVFGEAAFGVISAVLTLLILFLTEIIPKTVGAQYWSTLTKPVNKLIKITIFITYPFVLISALITKLFSKKGNESTTSRAEIAALTNIGTKEGLFSNKENKIIQNILRLKNIKVKEIMTPRVVVATVDENMSLLEFLKHKEFLKFSRIPVYSENNENITGYVLRQEVFENLAEGKKELKLKDLKHSILKVPNFTAIFSLWESLLEKKDHIALIIDEYGGMDGIVSMEDIIETLLGLEIMDEKDTVTDMQKYARERWEKRQVKYDLIDDLKNTGNDDKS
ncbi:CNNM domain-containing protein [Brumimicrobium oceani]|uniref:Hemolysin n=1 Tax=Brumimicrobium oceani TaxID=2100725 RepID=A0A2U2XFT8_9FLAO|nr:CNNM domain-containing protein [Brumimicrobium oceani]PWH86617.1 hemolysin [Brumimicrobium oceani]